MHYLDSMDSPNAQPGFSNDKLSLVPPLQFANNSSDSVNDIDKSNVHTTLTADGKSSDAGGGGDGVGEASLLTQRRLSTSSSGSNPPTPQPQTPAGGYAMPFSPGSPQMVGDPVHDLPHPLLNAGWRKFWSNREQRPYFFNKFTNESSWEMPVLGTQVAASDVYFLSTCA